MSNETDHHKTEREIEVTLDAPAHGRYARKSETGPVEGDDLLVRRCRQGDFDSYGQLVQKHEARVRCMVVRLLGPACSADDVDDTLQDIFVQVWRALPRYRGDAQFSTWLYRVATNMALKEWRRKGRRRTLSVEDLPESFAVVMAAGEPGPEAVFQSHSRDHALRVAVEALPEKQRTVVILHYYEGQTCEEVAATLGCSVGTVWSRLHYACRKLRDVVGWLGEP